MNLEKKIQDIDTYSALEKVRYNSNATKYVMKYSIGSTRPCVFLP